MHPDGLHRCAACASPLVELVDSRPAGAGTWDIHRRCPECRWHDGALVSDAALARFERELDAGRESLLRLLAAMRTSARERC